MNQYDTRTPNFTQSDTPSLTDSLRNSIQENPLAAGLIGFGALLLLFGNKRSLQGLQSAAGGISSSVKSSADSIATGAQSAASAVGDAMHSTRAAIGTAGEKISDMSRSLTDTAGSLADGAQSAMRNSMDGASNTVSSTIERASSASGRRGRALFNDLQKVLERQPLAIGAIGLAIGSAVAASLPTSRLESETFGDTSDAFRRSVTEHFAEQSDQLAETAKHMLDAVKEESQAQGLTPDQLKRDFQSKVSGLSEAFRDSVTERTS